MVLNSRTSISVATALALLTAASMTDSIAGRGCRTVCKRRSVSGRRLADHFLQLLLLPCLGAAVLEPDLQRIKLSVVRTENCDYVTLPHEPISPSYMLKRNSGEQRMCSHLRCKKT